MRSDGCKICNTPLGRDLFSAVTGEDVCSLCKQIHIGGLPTTPGLIAVARKQLGLKDGEFLEQDRAVVARCILGR